MDKKSLTEEELNIVNLYLKEGKSIREIARLKGCGRTSINTIINKYSSITDENYNQVEQRKKDLLNNKRKIDKSNQENSELLSDEQIGSMYIQIMYRQKSLTVLSKETGKHRDTIRKAIIKYLDDEDKVNEFKDFLKQNQKLTRTKYFDNLNDKTYSKLLDAMNKQKIFDRLRKQRRLTGRKPDSYELFEKKYNNLMKFFLERNNKIEEVEDRISKERLQKMMLDCPNLLTLSLENKIKPITNMLDSEYGLPKTSYLLKKNPVILTSSLLRTSLQVKILKDSNTSKYVLENPKTFRFSPEFMYALIKYWESRGKEGTPFISKSKLYRLSGLTPEILKEQYDVRDTYGDDEYFSDR